MKKEVLDEMMLDQVAGGTVQEILSDVVKVDGNLCICYGSDPIEDNEIIGVYHHALDKGTSTFEAVCG